MPRKLKLELEALEVESFATERGPAPATGTVHAHERTEINCSLWISCEGTCEVSCWGSCETCDGTSCGLTYCGDPC